MLLSLTSVHAHVTKENRQKIFPVGSSAYDAITQLYIMEGMALPSTTGPWSAKELDLMLSRINPDALGIDERALYNYAYSQIKEKARLNPNDILGFGLEGKINLKIMAHTNKFDFNNPDDWGDRDVYNPPDPFVEVPFETWIGNNVYGYIDLALANSRSLINMMSTESHDIGNGTSVSYINYDSWVPVFTNVLFLTPADGFSDFDLNFPFRAFASLGDDWWNITLGRDRMSWGPGVTGNFAIGDHIPYHNNARFTAFTDSFKYTFSASFFVHPMNYFKDNGEGIYYFDATYDQDASRNGVQMFMAHRLEWRILDKANIVLTEAVMYQNESGMVDPLVISPTTIFHNFYIRGNANSLLTLEVDYTPLKHWNIYAQFALDDISMPGEATKGEAEPPSALAYMLGSKVSFPYEDGVIYGSIEGVYTDPWFYLRDSGERNGNKYGNSFIIAMPEWVNKNGYANYDLNYLGYKYGGDAAVFDIRAGYKKYGKWFMEGSLTYIAHGTINLYTRPGNIVKGSYDDPKGLSTKHPSTGSYLYGADCEAMNAIEHTVITTLRGGYTLFKSLDISASVSLINVVNPDNIKENPSTTDFQITIGASYTF